MQSVALKLITEREHEIELFNPEDLVEPEIVEPVDPIQQRIDERVSNLRSDASKESSSEQLSTGITKAEQEAKAKAEQAATE